MISAPQLAVLESFAIDLAEVAAEVIRPFFRRTLAVEDKGGRAGYDPVTIADREAEVAMRGLIAEHYPEHGVFGEEQGFSPGSSQLTWVLDPIDGTRAFICGLLNWGTLIALHDGRQVALGLMSQPYTRELFIGSPGGSRMLVGGEPRSMRTRACADLTAATLSCTSPQMFAAGREENAFRDLVGRVRLARFGGDCYAYCMLAMGCIDLCVDSSLAPYDIQALIPIVEGAGGSVSTWAGEDPGSGGQIVAAGDPRLHEQALAVLAAGVLPPARSWPFPP